VAGATASCHNERFQPPATRSALILLRTLLFVGALALAALVLAWLHAPMVAMWVLVAGLALLVGYHVIYLSRLHHWAALPRQRELPYGFGSWGHAFDRIGRFMRQDANERTETATELERLHAAVDLLPDGLVVLDRFDHVQWSNRAAQDLHGIFGTRRPIDHFVRQPEFLAYLRDGDFSRSVTMSLPSTPGRRFALKIVPTDEAYRLLVTRDITETSRLEQMRRDFVANVSHEIRTPLTVVAGFVETLLDMELPAEERRRCLEMVQKQTTTMQRLVEDLLTLATLESASLPPEHAAVAVEPLLQAIVADVRALSAGRHPVALRIETDAGLRGAPAELDSAVRNLLTNAVRYTPDGGTITVDWRVIDGEGVLSVRDTGIGIAAEHLPRLTERFYRVDRGRSRDTGGTGLGLAIVKHVAQRHHARLDIESRVGYGSTFSLRFPAARLATAASLKAAAERAEGGEASDEDPLDEARSETA
jgi:two-component system, OmpR family, phosphate regulon sensor histidine kinase PhoR